MVLALFQECSVLVVPMSHAPVPVPEASEQNSGMARDAGTCTSASSAATTDTLDVLKQFPPAFVRFLRDNDVNPAVFATIHDIPRYVRYALH